MSGTGDASEFNKAKIIRSGWLSKSGPAKGDQDKGGGRRMWSLAAVSMMRKMKRHGDYKRRFFVLDGDGLKYYKTSARKDAPKGVIPLNTVLDVKPSEREGAPPFAFDLTTDVRSFTLAAETAVSSEAWISLLQQQMRSAGPRMKTNKGATRQERVGSLESRHANPNAPETAAAKVGRLFNSMKTGVRKLRRNSTASPDKAEHTRKTRTRKVSMVFTVPPAMELADRADLPRWSHVTGNAPRTRLSVFADHRLQHLPMFSPLLDHMHRLAPVLPVGPDRRSLPRSVGEAFGSTPLGATNPSVRQQELGQEADMAWALLPRHTTSDAVAATADRTHRLRRAAASMLPSGNERELEEALRHFVLLTLPPETVLCRRGQPSECMYILLQGKLRVEAVVDEELCGAYAQQKFNIHREEVTKGDWVHVDAVAAPAVIEIAAFVHGEPYTATVTTAADSILAVLTRPGYVFLQRTTPEAALGVAVTASLSRPHQLLGCVPCLVVGLSNTTTHTINRSSARLSPLDEAASVGSASTAGTASIGGVGAGAGAAGAGVGAGVGAGAGAGPGASAATGGDADAGVGSVEGDEGGDGLQVDTQPVAANTIADLWLYPYLHAPLAALFRSVQLKPGSTLYGETDIGDAAYVIVQGSMSVVVKDESGGDVQLAVLSRGSCVGERCLVEPGPRRCQAVALTRCVLWRLTHASLYRAIEHRPIVYRIICNAVLRRCAASLVTLPLFEFITKDSPQGAARLDVLADLFTCHTLSTSLPEVGAQSRGSPTRARPSSMSSASSFGRLRAGLAASPQAARPKSMGSDLSGGNLTSASAGNVSDALPDDSGELGSMAANTASLLLGAASVDTEDTTAPCSRELSGADLEALFLVAAGSAKVVSYGKTSLHLPGQWIGANTLFQAHHSQAVQQLSPGSDKAPCVLLCLDCSRIEAWASTFKGGMRRLRLWQMTQKFTTVEYDE